MSNSFNSSPSDNLLTTQAFLSTNYTKVTPPKLFIFVKKITSFTRRSILVLGVTLTALTSSAQTNTWDGSSSANWNTAANWSLNQVPTSAHDVVIPNGVTGTITVNTAAVCKSITLTGGNTANTVTISAGSSLTVTNNITINAGTGSNDNKILNVATGTLSCANIIMATTGNDDRDCRLTISSGTVTVSGDITMNGSAARNQVTMSGAGTLNIGGDITGGDFTTASGSTVNYNGAGQTIRSATYHHLILAGSGTATLGGALTVNGNITLSSGTVSTSGSNYDISIAGNWTNNGVTFSGGTSDVFFTGTGTIGGTTSTTFPSITFTSTSSSYTMSNSNSASTLTIAASSTSTSLTHSGSSALTIGGSVTINQPTANNTNASWNINAGSATVGGLISYAGTGSTTNTRVQEIVITTGTLNANGGITFATVNNTGRKIVMNGGAGNLNLKGALTLGGQQTLTAGTTSTFSYTGNSSQSVNFFSSGAYNNLYIDNTSATGASLTGAITSSNVTGNIVVGSVNTLSLLTSSNSSIGMANAKSLTVSAGSAMNAGTSIISMGTSATVTINGKFTTANTVAFTGIATGAISSTNSPSVSLGSASTIEFNAVSTQSVTARTDYANVTLSGASKTIATGVITLSGDLTINSGATYNGTTNNPTLNIGGDFSNSGTFNQGTGTLTFTNGQGVANNIMGTTATTFGTLALNNSNGLILANSVNSSINTALTFTNGKITTNSNVLILASGIAVNNAGVNGWVIGNLRWNIPTGANVARNFFIGDATNYTNASVAFTNVSTAGTLTGSTTSSDHPNILTSGVDPVLSVNRYWTLTNSGIVFTNTGNTASVVFNYVNGDKDGGVNTSTFISNNRNGSTWTTNTMGALNSLNTQVTGLTAFGDFQIGNQIPAIATNTVTADQTICSGQTPTGLAGTSPSGGNGIYTYLWESSIINATTGFVSASGINNTQNYTPGALTQDTWYRRTVYSGNISNVSTAIQITINEAPSIISQPLGAEVCAGSSINLSITASGLGLTYQWRKGGSDISGATTSGYSITSAVMGDAGNYDVVVNGTCNPSVTSNSTVVTVYALPNAPAVTTSPSTATICIGSGAVFTATNTGGTVDRIFSSTNNSNISVVDNSNSSYTYSSNTISGSGGLTLQATDVVSVTLYIDDENANDLDIFLVDPSGTRAMLLSSDNGGTGSDYNGVVLSTDASTNINTVTTAPVTGTYRPEGSITSGTSVSDRSNAASNGSGNYNSVVPANALTGASIDGAWSLRVWDDNSSGSSGTIDSWTLTIKRPGGVYSNVITGPSVIGVLTYSGTNNSTGISTISPSTLGVNNYNIVTVDGMGCSSSANIKTVTVNPVPGDNAGIDKTYCNGLSTTIGAASTVGNTYSWIPSTALNSTSSSQPTANPTTTTTYTLTETITATGCTSVNTVTVTVNPLPGNNTGGNKSVCYGSSVQLGGANIVGHTYAWSPSTALTSTTISNPSANPTNNITYTLTETITATGCSSTNSITVTVNPLPTVSVSTDYCGANGNVALTASSTTTPGSYLWSNGGTTNPLSVDLAGIYAVTVTDVNGCTGLNAATVAVELVTNGNFQSGNNGFTSSYTFSPSTYTGGTTGLWLEGKYAIGDDANDYHPNFYGKDHTSGSDKFMIVNGAAGSPVVWSQIVTVQPNTVYYFSAFARSLNNSSPFAQLQFAVDGNVIGTGAVLSAGVNSNSGPFIWQRFYGTWNSGTSTSVVLSIVDLQTSLGGNDFGLDDISCSSLAPLTFAAVPYGFNSVVCEGSDINLKANRTGGASPFIYSWSGPNSFSSSQENPNISGASFAMNGTYYVTITDGYGCASTGSTTITISELPSVTVTPSLSLVCSPTSPALTATNSGGVVSQTFSGTTGLISVSIPDNANYAYPYSVIKLNGSGGASLTASDVVQVTLNITHGDDNHLDIFLVDPSGTRAMLLTSDNGSTGNNYTNTILRTNAATNVTSGTAPFTNTYRPEGTITTAPDLNGGASGGNYTAVVPANALNGAPIDGTWTLMVFDDASGSTGTLTNWALDITKSGYSTSFSGPATIGSVSYSGTNNTTATATVTPPVGVNNYTATTTLNGEGCTVTSSPVTITVNQKSANPTSATASATTICYGDNVTLNLNGGGGGTGEVIKWYSSSCGATLVGTGNNLSVTPLITTAYYGRYENSAPCSFNTACASVIVNVTPLAATPVAIAGSGATISDITVNWNTASGATGYFLDVATDSLFTNFVSGHNNLNVGNTTSKTVTGLVANTIYYYRVRSNNSCFTSSNSNRIAYSTIPDCSLHTWLGTAGTDWFNNSNWNPANYPTACADVIIPVVGSGNYPKLDASSTSDAYCKSLTINNSAQLEITSGYNNNLNVIQDISNDGTINTNGIAQIYVSGNVTGNGAINTQGNSQMNISGNLTTGGAISTNGNSQINVSGDLSNSGSISNIGSSSITLNGISNIISGVGNFGDAELRINTGGSYSLQNSITGVTYLKKIIIDAGGVFNMAGFDLTAKGIEQTGNFNQGSGTLFIEDNGGISTLTKSTFNAGTGTTYFSLGTQFPAGNQIIPSADYYNLKVRTNSGFAATIGNGADLSCNNIDIQNPGIAGGIALVVNPITVGGDFTLGNVSPGVNLHINSAITRISGTGSFIMGNNDNNVITITKSNNSLPVPESISGFGTLNFFGTVTYNSNSDQVALAGNYKNMIVSTGTGNRNLNGNINVSNSLTVSAGIINTGLNKIVLSTTATLSETPTTFVLGKIETNRNLSVNVNNTFGGLGIEVKAQNNTPGNTLCTRVIGSEVSIGCANGSALRYFTLTPSVNTGLNAVVVFNYYDTPYELNGFVENYYIAYKSTDGGINWLAQAGPVDVVNNKLTMNGQQTLGAYTTTAPFPLGGNVTPLSTIICAGNSVALSVTGAKGRSYEWQQSTDNVLWSSAPGINNTFGYTATPSTSKVYYRFVAHATECWDVASNTVIVEQSSGASFTINVVEKTDNSITLNWSPVGTGNYNIVYNGSSSGSISSVTPPKTISGLLTNGTYNITITQTGTGLTGCPASGDTSGVTTLCSAPTGVTVSSPANKQLKVDWSGDAGNYRVYYREVTIQGSYLYKDVTTISNSGTVSITTGLYGGGIYEAYVVRKDCPLPGISGQKSALYYTTVLPSSVCVPTPTITEVKSTCPGQIEVSMSGSPTGNYVVFVQRLTPTLAGAYKYNVSGGTFQVHVGQPGQTFAVGVASKCVSGTSDMVMYPGGITIKPLCNPIGNLVLSNPTCSGFTASWNREICSENQTSTYQLFIKRDIALTWNSYPVNSPIAPVSPYLQIKWLGKGYNMSCYVKANYICNGYTIGGPSSTVQTISTLSAGCRDEEQELIEPETPSTQIISADNSEAISIYPNPNNGQFTLDISRLSNEAVQVRMEVMNVLGQTVLTRISEAKDGHGNEIITLPGTTSAGTYFVRVTIGSNVYTAMVNVSK